MKKTSSDATKSPAITVCRDNPLLRLRKAVNKTVTINAPPGTTVVYGDATPASAYQGGYDCYYDRGNRRRCYPRHNPPLRQVYRVEGQSGSIGQTYEGGGYYIGGQISR